MKVVYLTILPGGAGERAIPFETGTTLADLIAQENLTGRTISYNGSLIDGNFSLVQLTHDATIVATQPVKGN